MDAKTRIITTLPQGSNVPRRLDKPAVTHQVIQSRDELAEHCAVLARAPWLAVDTEFERVRTYYPRLCLVQVACPEAILCVCPLSIEDLSPLVDVLLDRRVLKIIHAARQDLEVLYPVCERVPGPLFDTQIAAALVGENEQVSYQQLVADRVGVQLDKAHTRADWCKRPLTDELVQYAVDDVRYLGDLYQSLRRELVARGRLHWLQEDCRELEREELYASDPDTAYRRLGRGHSLSVPKQHALKALANWRERTAQEQNLPRNWVASDANLMDIAIGVVPESPDFGTVQGLRRGFERRYGSAVTAVLRDCAARTPQGRVWRRAERLTAAQKTVRDQLMDALRARAGELGVAVPVLGTRKDIDGLLRGATANPLLRGWRREVVGDSLRALVEHPDAVALR